MASETVSMLMNDIYFGECDDNAFYQPVSNVSSVANVAINFDNQGALQHNWPIVRLGEGVPAPQVRGSRDQFALKGRHMLGGPQ
jgi:hypothetical protein